MEDAKNGAPPVSEWGRDGGDYKGRREGLLERRTARR